MKSKKKRVSSAVNAGSMADIAFLLLIFFLVTTTIAEDKGLRVKLPPWDPQPPINIPGRYILTVKINAANELMVEGEKLAIAGLREKAMNFIANPLKLESLPSSPKKAIITLQNDRGTYYETYVTVYDQLKSAYDELWNKKSQQLFYKPYDDLTLKQQKEIRNEIPLIISEAEPTNLALK